MYFFHLPANIIFKGVENLPLIGNNFILEKSLNKYVRASFENLK